jgi:hypothetical protein
VCDNCLATPYVISDEEMDLDRARTYREAVKKMEALERKGYGGLEIIFNRNLMQYTSFRIKRETYRKLVKIRNKKKQKSIDEAINYLLTQAHETESNLL